MKKRIVYFLVLFFGGSLLTYGFFASFLFNVDQVHVNLATFQSTTTPLTISFDYFYGASSGPASYRIVRRQPCDSYDANGNCVSATPDLCPYLSLQPVVSGPKKSGFQFNPPFWWLEKAVGEFDVPNTTSDDWTLAIESPCFVGECPVDYDHYLYGDPLPQNLNGETFQCTLVSESNDPPQLVKHIGVKQAFAATSSLTILVSATFTGGAAILPQACCSNVAFIPGLEASRLATKASGSENILWEPNRNADVRKLYLDTTGKSIDQGVYSKGIIDSLRIGGANIYQSFISDMDALVSGGTIQAWKPLAYDWRLSLSDIVDNGTLQADGSVESMVTEVEQLASSSKTGKVTIVTHSNGGLVGKVLIQRLEAKGEAGLIDKLITVAAPQLGTPRAIPDMLHGTNFVHGLIMSNNTSRGLSLNMPGAYQLLPSREYFNTVASPVITFNQSLQGFNNFIAQFGNQITDYATLKRFILDTTSNRTTNPDDTLDKILTLNPTLIRNADTLHSTIDSYVIPSNIVVSQIAGWGVDTISGIEYYKKPTSVCVGLNCVGGAMLDYKPLFVEDGDKTVVTESATKINADTYYLNLDQSNKLGTVKIVHDNILENQSIKSLISNLLQDSTTTPQFITTAKPPHDPNSVKYRISVHSPVSIDLYDTAGRHTGLISNSNLNSDIRRYEEQIPNSYYIEVGDGKYSGFGGVQPTVVKLVGTGVGTFTLNIEQLKGGVVVKRSSYSDIPVTLGTKAQITIGQVASMGLSVDYNGDGVQDSVLGPEQKFVAKSYHTALRSIVIKMEAKEVSKKNVITKIDATIKMIEAGMIKDPEQRIREYLSSLEGASTTKFDLEIIARFIDYVSKFQFDKR